MASLTGSKGGSIGTSNGSNYATRSLVHEAGHWLGLIHIWGNGTGDEEKNMSLFKMTTGGYDYMNLAAKQKQILLKIGILF